MCKYLSPFVFGVMTMVIVTDAANGQDAHCGNCGIACSSCDLCAHTVMVPMWVTETRMKTTVVKKQVEREETYTVFKRVPVKRKYTKEKCYLKDEVRTKTITQEKCHRVGIDIVSEFPVKVPVTEVREQIVPREVCTEDGVVVVEEPCERAVTTLQEEWQSANCCKEDVVFETTKRDIDYCVRVPKTHKYVCAEETEYKLVPVEKTRKVMACVPEIVEVPQEVTVCKLVPRTVPCCPQCCRGKKGSHRHRCATCKH
jgi:hypothetical protein